MPTPTYGPRIVLPMDTKAEDPTESLSAETPSPTASSALQQPPNVTEAEQVGPQVTKATAPATAPSVVESPSSPTTARAPNTATGVQ